MRTAKGDCLDILKRGPNNSVDSLVTDPPAGISFMGKDWDGDKGGRDGWVAWLTEVMTECLRVLKPGGHALVWALPRTSHWTMTALEDAGFEIRDVVTHLFGTGFPKSLDVSKAIDKEAGATRRDLGPSHFANKGRTPTHNGMSGAGTDSAKERVTVPATDAARQWEGFGTALKPACEFWILCRKPISEKTVAKNVLKWGTGALNIDGARIGLDGLEDLGARQRTTKLSNEKFFDAKTREFAGQQTYNPAGRFPANLVLDEEAAQALDEQTRHLHSAGFAKPDTTTEFGGETSMFKIGHQGTDGQRFGDSGGASRFFYVAKASKSDRGAGNTHPTVKSTKLMSYLVRLVTPPGGTVLDPFMGSGSTGVAAKAEDMRFIGIEQDQGYFDIANSRLKKAE